MAVATKPKAPQPAAAPTPDLTQHPAYQLGVEHAHAGIAPNPFGADRNFLNEAAPSGAPATLPRTAPVTSPKDRAGITYPNPPANPATQTPDRATGSPPSITPHLGLSGNPVTSSDPFKNGFFKPATDRYQQMVDDQNSRLAGGRNVVKSVLQGQGRDQNGNALANIPRAPGPQPAVGGQRAILPLPPAGTGVEKYTAPGTTASTSYDQLPAGTRRPVIADASGDVTSRFADRTDPSLDKNYLAGKDRDTIVAALPRVRDQKAVVPQTSSRFFGSGVA